MTDQNSYTDEQIVSEILTTNPELFGLIIDRYEQKLLRYVRRITNIPKHEAEDIVQDVFIKSYENLNGFNQELSFNSWIYRICHNYVISLHRKKQTQKNNGFLDLEDTALSNLRSEIDVLKEITNDELKKEILKTLDILNPVYKDVIVLKFFEEKSYEEISDILKKPIGTIGTLIHRAKKDFINKWSQN